VDLEVATDAKDDALLFPDHTDRRAGYPEGLEDACSGEYGALRRHQKVPDVLGRTPDLDGGLNCYRLQPCGASVPSLLDSIHEWHAPKFAASRGPELPMPGQDIDHCFDRLDQDEHDGGELTNGPQPDVG